MSVKGANLDEKGIPRLSTQEVLAPAQEFPKSLTICGSRRGKVVGRKRHFKAGGQVQWERPAFGGDVVCKKRRGSQDWSFHCSKGEAVTMQALSEKREVGLFSVYQRVVNCAGGREKN